MSQRNAIKGATMIGSTQAILSECKVGEQLCMDIHNASGLTDSQNHIAYEVKVERMDDRPDGTVRGRLITPLMLGKHSIQSEIVQFGEMSDYYKLTLNAM